ncbi:unnamed protein product [Protopolystoma xenopodis]|uniref:Uncharacterized protein n=1 Tax=Protopolystoma xenopodis TaxID=117903 RepID=A0A3S5CBJ5_9PLAT|nr:unnamed protein product [Protopolystoma xenopodis]
MYSSQTFAKSGASTYNSSLELRLNAPDVSAMNSCCIFASGCLSALCGLCLHYHPTSITENSKETLSLFPRVTEPPVAVLNCGL